MFELDPTTIALLVNDLSTLIQGPPSSLPDPVPDFVTDLLGGIQSFLDGGVDRLGDVARAVTPGGR